MASLPETGPDDPIANTLGRVVFGSNFTKIDPGTKSFFNDTVSLLRQIASSLGYGSPGGLGYSLAKGAVLDSGPMALTDINTGRVGYAYGAGEHTETVARQLANALSASRNTPTVLGGTDLLGGLGDSLAKELTAAAVARRGTSEGDVLWFGMSPDKNTTADFEDNIQKLRNVADPESMEGLEKILSIRKKLDEFAGEGKNFDDNLDPTVRADAIAKVKEIKELDGRKISSADIDTAIESTSLPMNQSVVSSRYVNDIKEVVAAQAGTLKAWSEMTGKEDLASLQSLASKLKIDAIASKKGTEELADMMTDIRVEAEMSGRSVEEVLHSYESIADAYEAAGRSYSAADIKSTHEALERFRSEDVHGIYTGPKTPEQRAEEFERSNIDTDNFNLGIYGARMYMESGVADEAQQAHMQQLMQKHEQALAAGDTDTANKLNKELMRYQASQFGANWQNQQFIQYAIKNGKLGSDRDEWIGAKLQTNATTAAKELLGGNSAEELKKAGLDHGNLANLITSYTQTVGNTDDVTAIGAMTSALRGFQGLSGDKLKDAIAGSDKLNAKQKEWLQMAADQGMTGQQLYSFAHGGLARLGTTRGGRTIVEKMGDIFTPPGREEAKDDYRTYVKDKEARGEYAKDPEQLDAFIKAIFNSEGTDIKEQREKAKHLSDVLKGDNEEAKISALLELKDKEGNDLIALSAAERKGLSEGDQLNKRREKAQAVLGQEDVVSSITKSLDQLSSAGEKEKKDDETAQQTVSSLQALETALQTVVNLVATIVEHKNRESVGS